MTDAERELALRLSAVCAEARRGGMNWLSIFSALSQATVCVMRSCSCPDCRRKGLRNAKALPNELRRGMAYAIDKYPRRVGSF
jgi:hypothetical protein